MSTKILDYSFARPDPGQITSNGFTGVMRYLSPTSNAGKFLTPGERDSLRAAGIDIGLVWEWYAKRAVEGHDAGVQDATAALNQANSLGFPSDRPIYFAVDWDATPGDQVGINAYLDGAASVIGANRVGIYGGYWPVSRAMDAGKAAYGWQTYAWSGGQWYPKAQLRQTLNGQWGGSVDFGEAEVDDWGQWRHDVAPAPIPPAPQPAPAPSGGTGKYVIQSGDTFWALEAKNGWTHGTLQNLNPSLNPNTLQIGQTINVPGGAQPQPAPSGGSYQIRRGDTFWGLEAANGWAHGTLQGLNPGVNPTALQIGQTIRIPGGGVTIPPAPTPRNHYTIVGGDTFWALELAHGWQHGVLQSLNPGVDPTKLQIGEQINVP